MKIISKVQIAFIFLIVMFLGSACDVNVYFKDAIPPDVNAISSIPIHFQGIYECQSDGSRVYTFDKLIYMESYREFTTTLAKVKETENCSILNRGLFLPDRNECIPFEYIGNDSIHAMVYEIDTLFFFGQDQVAKMYKDRLFINMKNDVNEWVAWMVTPLDTGELLWEIITVPNEVENIEEITYNYKYTGKSHNEEQYVINPTLVEFEHILDKGFLKTCDILTPLNIIK